MDRTIRLIDQQRVAHAIDLITSLPADGSYKVAIGEDKSTRSASQRGLQWMWYTDISNVTGETKEEVHERCKATHLKPILLRDDEAYRELVESLRKLYKSGDEATAIYLNGAVIKLLSTTRLNETQMSEYLTCVEREHAEQGMWLRRPDDYESLLS